MSLTDKLIKKLEPPKTIEKTKFWRGKKKQVLWYSLIIMWFICFMPIVTVYRYTWILELRNIHAILTILHISLGGLTLLGLRIYLDPDGFWGAR